MILESAQMICTVLNERGIDTPYKSTHKNHPCVKWLRESDINIYWLHWLVYYLNEEYKYRFDKEVDHKSYTVMVDSIGIAKRKGGVLNFSSKEKHTPFKCCMPNYCKISEDPVDNYRNYYMLEKKHIATWTKRGEPYWWKIV
jgi:hypothetical protein